MRKTLAPEIHDRAQTRALQIFALETQLNGALTSAAALIADLAKDGADAGVHISADQKLITAGVELIAALNAARARAIDVHDKAAAVARVFGIEITALNPGVKPPDADALPPLMRVVEDAKAA